MDDKSSGSSVLAMASACNLQLSLVTQFTVNPPSYIESRNSFTIIILYKYHSTYLSSRTVAPT